MSGFGSAEELYAAAEAAGDGRYKAVAAEIMARDGARGEAMAALRSLAARAKAASDAFDASGDGGAEACAARVRAKELERIAARLAREIGYGLLDGDGPEIGDIPPQGLWDFLGSLSHDREEALAARGEWWEYRFPSGRRSRILPVCGSEGAKALEWLRGHPGALGLPNPRFAWADGGIEVSWDGY